jgi:hypothetical protein
MLGFGFRDLERSRTSLGIVSGWLWWGLMWLIRGFVHFSVDLGNGGLVCTDLSTVFL